MTQEGSTNSLAIHSDRYINSSNSNPSVEIMHLVEIMIRHKPYISEWQFLPRCLDSQLQDVVRWERGFNTTILSWYDLFFEMLTSWVINSSSGRSVHDLYTALRSGDYPGYLQWHSLADTLEASFKEDAIIQCNHSTKYKPPTRITGKCINPDHSVEVEDLVEIMIKDRILLNKWIQLAESLCLRSEDRKIWELGINTLNLKHYDVFLEMLTSWVINASSGRIVHDLCTVLRSHMECVSVAATLEASFKEDAIIQCNHSIKYKPPKRITGKCINPDHSVELEDLVEIMIKEYVLLREWTQLVDSLRLHSEDKEKWQRGINNLNLKHYDVFLEMLQSWVSSATNSNGKTVYDLCRVLEKLNLLALVEKIQEDIGEESRICICFLIQEDGRDGNDFATSNVHGHEIPIKQLVKVLTTDQNLLRKWSDFSNSLNCQSDEKLEWERGTNNSNLPSNLLFSKILISWVSRNSKKTVRDLCQILKSEYLGCIYIAEKLEEKFWERCVITQDELCLSDQPHESEKINKFIRSKKEIKWPITHGLLVPTSNFSGRRTELQQLQSNFKSKLANLIVICGLGGLGKTELCRKFAIDVSSSHDEFHTKISRIWLHGETFETLRDSVLQLSRLLGISNEANPSPAEYFEYLVLMILEKSDRLLVIIDNLDIQYEEAKKFIELKGKYDKIFIIVTSRNSLVLDDAGFRIKLEVLPKDDTRIMLKCSMPDLTDSDADELGDLVQKLPLALQQALAYIKQQRNHVRTRNYNVSNYVEDFEQNKSNKSKMLGHRLNPLDHNYRETTAVTWDMTISKIKEGAVEILKIVAHLDPDGIELEFLERICKPKAPKEFDDNLDIIFNYSLIKIEGKILSIHRLVQEVVRLKIEKPEEFYKTLFDSVLLACGKFGIEGPLWSELGHLKSVYKFAWQCEMGEIKCFSDALNILLKHDRIECAVEFTKLHFKNIQFSSTLDELGKRRLLERVFKWASLIGGDDNVTNETIEY